MPAPRGFVLGALLFATACGDSSLASPSRATNPLAEEGEGSSQSPIHIRSDRVRFVEALPALQFRYGRDAALDVINTGSPDEQATVRVEVTAGGGELRISGERYRLLQFHWHAPSEHRINGKEFPLEMHLVHQDESDGLLVVGVLIQQGQKEHRPLARIFRNLPADNGDHVSLEDFPLQRLLPERRRSIRYSGSLTTPPFTEPVAWVVLKQPIALSADQINAFRGLFPEGNSREPQPLHGRRLVTDADRLQGGVK